MTLDRRKYLFLLSVVHLIKNSAGEALMPEALFYDSNTLPLLETKATMWIHGTRLCDTLRQYRVHLLRAPFSFILATDY